MKAIQVDAFGGPQNLALREVTDLRPGDNEVLIDIMSTSVNPIDWKIVSGAMRSVIPVPLPFTPGADAAGTVIAVGRDVTTFAPGDEVMGFIGIAGGYATRAAVSAERLARKPGKVPLTEAGAIPTVALTAWQALFEHGGLRAGQKILIHAAAGGVGSVAVQLAALAGAEVIGTASGANLDYVRSLGAATVIDYGAEDFSRRVAGADMVLDLVGGYTQDQSWSVLKPGGVLVSCVSQPDISRGRASGAEGKRFSTRPDGNQLAEIAALYASGKLRTQVDSVFPLDEASHAMSRSMTRHAKGKVIIQMANQR
ncbi:oxidoreductase [Cupriavidus sp. SK-4]|uniref:NADP-dependent oxidoreductase n=1 Tax=Cupriavidus sp. SK-4 TaxID=574750 RepID=UPI00044C56B1|nr:NADP-dependent oxidoreductase [Cupriavidus sp. SK-4]EYS85657.1 oxidoreductase [Cupriavidus sp. SK-4]